MEARRRGCRTKERDMMVFSPAVMMSARMRVGGGCGRWKWWMMSNPIQLQ